MEFKTPARAHKCAGSLNPVPGLQPGDTAFCAVCGQAVRVALTSGETPLDAWFGGTLVRIAPHVEQRRV